MEKKDSKIITLVLSLTIIIFSISFIFTEKKAFSENENRVLTTKSEFTFKKLYDGTFIKNFESLLTDQFLFRDKFMNLKTKIDKFQGKKDVKGVYISKENYLIEKYNKPMNNDKIIKKLNDFSNDLNFINFNLMLVPTSISINKEKLPKSAITDNQIENIKYIYDKINFDTIDVYKTLLENNKYYPMFYKLDHHWTSYGAYYSYIKYTKHNNINGIKLSNFDIEEVSNDFKGTLYSKVLDNNKVSDSIHKFTILNQSYEVDYVYSKKKTNTLYESKYLNKKDKYSYFLDNNHPLIVVTNKKINNGKELVIIKDSFANSIVPFLINHYEKIHVKIGRAHV